MAKTLPVQWPNLNKVWAYLFVQGDVVHWLFMYGKYCSCIPHPSYYMFRTWASLPANPCPMLTTFQYTCNQLSSLKWQIIATGTNAFLGGYCKMSPNLSTYFMLYEDLKYTPPNKFTFQWKILKCSCFTQLSTSVGCGNVALTITSRLAGGGNGPILRERKSWWDQF